MVRLQASIDRRISKPGLFFSPERQKLSEKYYNKAMH